MKRLFTLVLGAATLVAVQGCSKEAALYLGGPPGAIARLALSNSSFEMRVGQTAALGARGEDAVGNVTADATTFSSCDQSVVTVASGTASEEFTSSATVTAAGLGVSCVMATAGGFTDSIGVTVGPDGFNIVLDTVVRGTVLLGYSATDPSANTYQFSVEPYDASGEVLTGTTAYSWTSTNNSVLIVDPETGMGTAEAFGLGGLQVTAPGGASAVLSLDVGLPSFDGTLSAYSGEVGDVLTVTRNGGPEIDGNTEVWGQFGTAKAFIDGTPTASSLRLAVPATGEDAGRADIWLTNLGSSDVDRRFIFQMTASGTGTTHKYSATSGACSTAPDFDANASPAGWVYFSWADATEAYGGPDPDIWFKASAGASDRTVDLELDWMSADGGSPYADADVYVYDGCSGSATELGYSYDYNPPNPPTEAIPGLTIPAGGTAYIWVVVYDAQGSGFSNVRLGLH